MLWKELRAHKTEFKFRRQHPIRGFIVDFYCPTCRLAIELDGWIHDDREIDDTHRTEILETEDVHVLRFTNSEVLSDCSAVIEKILTTCHARLP